MKHINFDSIRRLLTFDNVGKTRRAVVIIIATLAAILSSIVAILVILTFLGEQPGISTVILLDSSVRMDRPFGSSTRLQEAKKVIGGTFVPKITDDENLALWRFGGSCPNGTNIPGSLVPTSDSANLVLKFGTGFDHRKQLVDSLKDVAPGGQSTLLIGMRAAINHVEETNSPKLFIMAAIGGADECQLKVEADADLEQLLAGSDVIPTIKVIPIDVGPQELSKLTEQLAGLRNAVEAIDGGSLEILPANTVDDLEAVMGQLTIPPTPTVTIPTIMVTPVTIMVNTTVDDITVNGNCTIREAITAANTDTAVDNCPAGSGTDTINLPAGIYSLSIPGIDENAALTGDLDITDDLIINGAGAATTTIDGGALDRVFDIRSGSAIYIYNITVQNGHAQGSNGGGVGGAIHNRGGSLTIVNSTITGSRSNIAGGGIYTSGIVDIFNSTISGNKAMTRGGGIATRYDGTANLNNVTVANNNATLNGGGISNLGTLTIANSTISGNVGDNGGGINNGISRSTNSPGIANLDNVTIVNNTARGDGGGIFIRSGTTVNVKSTDIDKNSNLSSPSGTDCSGTLNSQGHNHIGNTSGCTIIGDPTGNITDDDSLPGPL